MKSLEKLRIITQELSKTLKAEEIASIINMSRAFVYKWWKKSWFRQTRKRKGKLTEENKKVIENRMKGVWTDQGGSLRDCHRYLKSIGVNVSLGTVHNYVRKTDWGIPRKFKMKSPWKLTHHHKRERVRISKLLIKKGFTNYEKGIDLAKKVLYVDASGFYLNQAHNNKNHQIRLSPEEDVEEGATTNFKVKVKAYFAFCWKRVFDIIFIDSKLDSEEFVEEILPKLESFMKKEKLKYMQIDNDTIHISKYTAPFYRRKFWRGKKLQWPKVSSDMAPIENIFNILKNDVKTINARNKVELMKNVRDCWAKFNNDEKYVGYRTKLATNLPKRLDLVLKAKGNKIKY
jgi:hypothetical protein